MNKLWALAMVIILAGTAAGCVALSNDATETSVVNDNDLAEFNAAEFDIDSAVGMSWKEFGTTVLKVIRENQDRWMPQLVELVKAIKNEDWARAAEISLPLFADMYEKVMEALSDKGNTAIYLA